MEGSEVRFKLVIWEVNKGKVRILGQMTYLAHT